MPMNLKKSLKALFLILQIHMQRRCLHRSKTHSIRKVWEWVAHGHV